MTAFIIKKSFLDFKERFLYSFFMNPWIFFSIFLFVISFASAETDALETLDHSFNEISSLEARFLHKDSTGKSYQGTLFLKRPWKLRMQYDTPSPFLIVSDGESLIYEDHITQEAIYLPLESSPLSFLLDAKTDLKQSFQIESVRDKRDETIILCRDKKNYFMLTIIFSKKEKSIIGWVSKDAQGSEVKISLYNLQKNKFLKDDLFFFQQKPRWLTKPKGH